MSSLAGARFEPERNATARRAAAQEGRARLRAIVEGTLRTLAAALVGAALTLGAWQTLVWATHARVFAVRELELRGNQHAPSAELLRRSGLRVGENVFRADVARAARNLETHPWVRAARVERRFPASIRIEVEEHRAAAAVSAGATYLLADDGKLFKRAAPGEDAGLLRITGLSRDGFTRPETQVRLSQALHFLDAWRAQGLAVEALVELRADEDAWTARVRDPAGPLELRLGTSEFALQLRHLAQVRAALGRRNEAAARIDLTSASAESAVATLSSRPPGASR